MTGRACCQGKCALKCAWMTRKRPSSAMYLLRAGLEPPERFLGAGLELLAQELFEQPTPPPGREAEVSAEADAALRRAERRQGELFVVGDAEGQPHEQAELVRGGIHLQDVSGDAEQVEGAGRRGNPLADRERPGGGDAAGAGVPPLVEASGIEEGPDHRD